MIRSKLWMKEMSAHMCDSGRFPFTYEGVYDANPNPAHDVLEFTSTSKDPIGAFGYSFRPLSGGRGLPKAEVSTPKKRKRGPNE